MAIGERIRFFRNKKGVTQKYLGQVVGFPERSADVRMAQYETGSRTPKADLTRTLAGFFEVSTDALTVPDIDSDIGLMHTLFALEDIRGLTIGEIDGEICLKLDKSKGKTYVDMLEMLSAWAEQAKKLAGMAAVMRGIAISRFLTEANSRMVMMKTYSLMSCLRKMAMRIWMRARSRIQPTLLKRTSAERRAERKLLASELLVSPTSISIEGLSVEPKFT